jgi:hypothetical protein
VAKRRRLAAAVVAAGLAIGAAACSSSGASSPPTTSSPKAVVLSAVKASTAQKSARISVTMTLGAKGQGVSVKGQGLVDFGQTASDLTVRLTSVSGAGGEQAVVTFRSVLIGGVTYVNEPPVSKFLPGKAWVSEIIGTKGVTSDIPFNPAYIFKVATAVGAQVVALGASTANGQSVHGYDVTIADPSSVESEFPEMGLPNADKEDVSQFLEDGGTHFHLFVNGSNEVVQASLNTLVSTSSGRVGASLIIDFSDYGAAASIGAPPSNEVATIQQFASADNR